MDYYFCEEKDLNFISSESVCILYVHTVICKQAMKAPEY